MGVSAIPAFILHPRFDDQKPIEEIGIPVPAGVSEFYISASKPMASVRGSEGSFLGDGVEVSVATYSGEKLLRALLLMVLRPSDVALHGWKHLKVQLNAAEQEVRISVQNAPG